LRFERHWRLAMKPKRIKDWSELSGEWVAERKVDGHGGMVKFDEEGLAHFSNGQDVSEFLPKVKAPRLSGTVLQVEYAATRDGRKYSLSDDAHVMLSAGGLEKVDDPTIYVLGVLQYRDEDLRGMSWWDRMPYRSRVVMELDALIHELKVKSPEVLSRDEWDEVLPKWFEDGVEGVVFKHNLSTIKEGGRSKYWLKYKPVHTVDAWCDGYKEGTGKFEGLVGSLRLKLFDGDEAVEIGRCSGMNDETRRELTERLDAGEGFVVEAKYERWTLGGRLRFAQFKRVREDKTREDCTMAEQGPEAR
jgi:ATP-dependent DNA ligase